MHGITSGTRACTTLKLPPRKCRAMSCKEVLTRLVTAQILLADLRGKPNHASVSYGQCGGILELLGQRGLALEDLGVVGERIGQCAWATPAEKQARLEALPQAVRAHSTRAKPQCFAEVIHYFTEAQWHVLLGSAVDYNAKASTIVYHARQLGLRNPTEPTTARLTAFLLACVEGVPRARCLDPGHMRDVFKHVKSMLKPRKSLAPMAIVSGLSPDPADFQRQHPVVYATVFERGGPVPCQLPVPEVLALAHAIPMRDRKGHGFSGGATSPVMAASMGNLMQHAVQAVMANMMGSFGSMSTLGDGSPLQVFPRQQPRPRRPQRLQAALAAATAFPDMPQLAASPEPACSRPVDAPMSPAVSLPVHTPAEHRCELASGPKGAKLARHPAPMTPATTSAKWRSPQKLRRSCRSASLCRSSRANPWRM